MPPYTSFIASVRVPGANDDMIAEMAAMPGRERDAVPAAFERRQALLQRRPGRVDGARVVVTGAHLR